MTAARRFTECEYEQGYEKLATIFAGLEALCSEIATTPDRRQCGRLIDATWVLVQTGGFIADHMGADCGAYGDVFTWLEIPKGKDVEGES